jgi:hypothetical protein
MTLAAWHAEIVELHAFFQEWLDGTLPATDAAFTRLTGALDAAFTLIGPSGEVAERAALVRELRVAHGSRPGWRMWIEQPQLRRQAGDLTIATYQEWQQAGDTTTARISSAVFQRHEGAPNGLLWLHVHETWLPQA